MRKTAVFVIACGLLSGCIAPPGLKYTDIEIKDYPHDVQERIRKSEVVIGMTPVQVRYARGAPSYARTWYASGGKIVEEWSYDSFSLLTKTYVVFENGRVVKIETTEQVIQPLGTRKADQKNEEQ
ncbi:MAG: hypothetical protein HZA20_13880 [Nitrospirae bacterium]|nr:hypothetical protein [Nitrospirota bacterium]